MFLLVSDMLNYYHSRCIEQLLLHSAALTIATALYRKPQGRPRDNFTQPGGWNPNGVVFHP